jgi:periplasmic protein TonB
MKKEIVNSVNPSSQNFDDILFANRNKGYGAYTMRQSYDQSLKKASILTLLFLGMSCSLFFINRMFATPTDDGIFVTDVILADKINIEKPAEAPKPPKEKPVAPKVKTTAFVVPEPKPNPPVETPPPTVDALQNTTNVGATTQTGTDAPMLTPPVATTTEGTGTSIVAPVEKPTEILDFAQDLPEFEGGQAEMMRYLYKNIHYPAIARDNGIQGRVVLRFVVDELGNIADIVVLKDIGGGCAEEATRILKNMPRWKPGRQAGKLVKVRMTLPVFFRLSE